MTGPTDRLRVAYARSRLRTLLAGVDAERWVETSVLVRGGRTVAGRLGAAGRHSTLAAAGRTLLRWARASVLYRLSVPDAGPRPVTVDLRASYAAAPVVRATDALLPAAVRSYRGSTLRAALATAGSALARAAGTLGRAPIVRRIRYSVEPSDDTRGEWSGDDSASSHGEAADDSECGATDAEGR